MLYTLNLPLLLLKFLVWSGRLWMVAGVRVWFLFVRITPDLVCRVVLFSPMWCCFPPVFYFGCAKVLIKDNERFVICTFCSPFIAGKFEHPVALNDAESCVDCTFFREYARPLVFQKMYDIFLICVMRYLMKAGVVHGVLIFARLVAVMSLLIVSNVSHRWILISKEVEFLYPCSNSHMNICGTEAANILWTLYLLRTTFCNLTGEFHPACFFRWWWRCLCRIYDPVCLQGCRLQHILRNLGYRRWWWWWWQWKLDEHTP